jgi:hypothetical protein
MRVYFFRTGNWSDSNREKDGYGKIGKEDK